MSTIKGIINRASKVKWQREWNRAEVGRDRHEIVPKMPSVEYITPVNKERSINLNTLPWPSYPSPETARAVTDALIVYPNNTNFKI